MSLKVELPWPARELWPNWRGHWSKKAAKAKTAKGTAWALTIQATGFDIHYKAKERLSVAFTFHPPTRRRYDLDNALAASKALCDGIAEALRVDDVIFEPTLKRGEPVKGGSVVVTITEAICKTT